LRSGCGTASGTVAPGESCGGGIPAWMASLPRLPAGRNPHPHGDHGAPGLTADVPYALPEERRTALKSYHDIRGDGGSNVLQQVIDLEGRIQKNLAGVRHIVAIGSGKGGVGKSTLAFHLAAMLKTRGAAVALLDADVNGPSQARLGGVQQAVPLPANDGRLA